MTRKRPRSKPPSVSVLIPSYNRLDYLPRTLESVYAQTFQDFEVVVVDDGSTDGTRDWLRARRFPGLRCVRSDVNRGPAPTRNLALRSANGALIAFLDSDDLWAPGYLKAMAACFAGSRTQVACSDMCTIDREGNIILSDFYRTNPKVLDPRFEALAGFRFCPGLASCVVRRSALDLVGEFDEGFKRIHDDKDLLYRLAGRFGPSAFRFIRRNLAYHRRHDAQMTSYIERGVKYLPSRAALSGWRKLSDCERELILDVVYFSSKHDCTHCDGLSGSHDHA